MRFARTSAASPPEPEREHFRALWAVLRCASYPPGMARTIPPPSGTATSPPPQGASAGADPLRAPALCRRSRAGRAIREPYKLTRKADPMLPWILLAAGFLVFAVMPAGASRSATRSISASWARCSASAMTVVFGRRAERGAYQQIEGQPGAAPPRYTPCVAAGRFPAVAVSRQQDVVDRAVGRPGVVLVAEGSPPACPARPGAPQAGAARSRHPGDPNRRPVAPRARCRCPSSTPR